MSDLPISLSKPATANAVKTIFITYSFLLLISVFTLDANGGMESYLVVFEEGSFRQEASRLYRAKVTVFMGGKKLRTSEGIKGSTMPNRFLYYTDRDLPVIASGEYEFDVRYSRKFGKALCLNGGGFTDTVNPNPTKHGQYVANGIWVHKGRSKGPVKGSEGCLTIDPRDWDKFISLFPGAEEWKNRRCQGEIIIMRNSDAYFRRPSRPSNLRIHIEGQ
ncbi:MAG: hypothetical protein SV775_09425 [Thermodesulfobacteriota bacterium]|nr:hypothetical protein [Thermodesulfobacteriota bacterium]